MASIFDVSKYILAHFDQPISPHKVEQPGRAYISTHVRLCEPSKMNL